MGELREVKYAIIGNSAAGVGAVEAIRSVEAEGSLAVISYEPYHTYSRALIGHYLCGETTREQLLYRPLDFYEKHKVIPLLGRGVTQLDVKKKTLLLSNPEEEIRWEKLLIGTGGKPMTPKIVGSELALTFTTLDDAERLKEAARHSKSAVVIGGGLIGIQAAEGLQKRGLVVTIVELLDRVLAPVLDEETSRTIEAILEEHGIRLVLGKSASCIAGVNGRTKRVTLNDGSEIHAEVVVMAVGVAPNLSLVSGTPIETGRGIIVDEHTMTSVPDVYAAGDVVEVRNKITGVRQPMPIWPNAYMGGRAAGFNMAGKETVYDGTYAMNSAVIYGFPVVSAGLVNPKAEDGCTSLVRKEPDRSFYRKILLRDGKVVGMVGYGKAVDRSGVIVGLMRDEVDVTTFAEKLLLEGAVPPSWNAPQPGKPGRNGERLGLMSLPEDMRAKRLREEAI